MDICNVEEENDSIQKELGISSEIDCDWNAIKQRLKDRMSRYTDETMELDKERMDVLLQRLQSRLGMSKEAIYKLLSES